MPSISGADSTSTDANQIPVAQIFSLRRPRDLKAGLASGLKSFGRSCVVGAGALLVGPFVGVAFSRRSQCAGTPLRKSYIFVQNIATSTLGLLAGIFVAVLGSVSVLLLGTAVAVIQSTRGLLNTPQAIVNHFREDTFWDHDCREWTLRSLKEKEGMKGENVDLPSSSGNNALVQSEDGSHIEWLRRQCIRGTSLDQNDYYALLGVPRDAPASAIKRAYFLKAREYHPDKNPGDITAKEKFQALSHAYQILSNDELRAKYDAHGVDGLDVNFIDGAELFAALFGSDKFAHLIGELKIATAVKVSGDISKIQQIQQERIDELAVNLKVLLMRYTCGDTDGFKMAMTEEAKALAEAPYGTTMLSSIGQAYQTQAKIFLGSAFSSGLMSLKYHGRVIKTHFKAASLAFKSYQTQQELLKLEQKSTKAQQEVPGSESVPIESKGTVESDITKARYEIEEKALPLMLETMWAINVVDIESTLCKVCKRVLQDPTVSSSELQLRANALLELGIIFRSFKDKINKSKTAREQMEDAFRRVIEKHSDQHQ